MKPEPLKNKQLTFVNGRYQGMRFFWKDSVASAVKGFRQDFIKEFKPAQVWIGKLNELIDKWFKDVIEE
ncbi:MAG: hypothetical protein ACTSUF_09770 [Candidatus Heimdallarchaeaceae archaeon]